MHCKTQQKEKGLNPEQQEQGLSLISQGRNVKLTLPRGPDPDKKVSRRLDSEAATAMEINTAIIHPHCYGGIAKRALYPEFWQQAPTTKFPAPWESHGPDDTVLLAGSSLQANIWHPYLKATAAGQSYD